MTTFFCWTIETHKTERSYLSLSPFSTNLWFMMANSRSLEKIKLPYLIRKIGLLISFEIPHFRNNLLCHFLCNLLELLFKVNVKQNSGFQKLTFWGNIASSAVAVGMQCWRLLNVEMSDEENMLWIKCFTQKIGQIIRQNVDYFERSVRSDHFFGICVWYPFSISDR